MATNQDKSTNGNSTMKLIIVSILCLGSIAFVLAQYADGQDRSKVNAPAAVEGSNPNTSRAAAPSRQDGPPSPEERQQRQQEMMAGLNLTPEQQAKIAKLPENADREERREQMDAILTPEQKTQMRSQMDARMNARMQERIKVLPPEEQAKFMEKMEERRAQGRGPGGGGPGGGGPGGGGGGGQRPGRN